MNDARDPDETHEGEQPIPGEQDVMVRFEGGPDPFNGLVQMMPVIVESKEPLQVTDKEGWTLFYCRDRTRWPAADGAYVVTFLERR